MADTPTPDPNTTAARIVRDATGEDAALPPEIEAAWARWIAGVQKVDERAKTLLRAAFEAGVEVGRSKTPPPGH